jgi:transposase-like protein
MGRCRIWAQSYAKCKFLFDNHFDDYVYAYEERFEAKAGPLREVVRPTVEAFLDCGRLYGGFARIRCPSCRSEHLLAFSCQTRNFCPSCQSKRSVLFAEKLRENILQPGAASALHVFHSQGPPRAFRAERRLLSLVSQTAYENIRKSFQKLLHRKDVQPSPTPR